MNIPKMGQPQQPEEVRKVEDAERAEVVRLIQLVKQLTPQDQAAVLQMISGLRLLAESKNKKQ